MIKSDFLKMIRELEELIRNYKLDEARSILTNLWIDQVPNELRSDFAQLSRRAGLNRLALKFVHELIHETKGASAKDFLEYASCLRRAGLHNEAMRILQRLPTTPASLLQQSFGFIQQWDYGSAASILVELLDREELSERESRVARVNLVASLIFLGDTQTAQHWLNPLIKECQTESAHLYLNSLELQTQILFAEGNLAQARHVLSLAKPFVEQKDGIAQMLLRKWGTLIELAENPHRHVGETLRSLREEIRLSGHWESLRSVDWEIAQLKGDARLAAKVYFGTPYLAFRRHVLNSPLGRQIPEVYMRRDERVEAREQRLVDGLTGENMPFSFGSIPYRASMLLLSDFYQPWTIYRLFDGLFPEEVFDPFSSPKRLYRLLERTRAELKTSHLPLEIQTSGNGFRLRPKEDGAVVVYERMNFHSVEDLVHATLSTKLQKQTFSIRDAAQILPLSPHQSARAIRKLVRSHDVEPVESAGKMALYRFKAA